MADKWAEWIDNLEYNFKYFNTEDAEAKKAALMVYGGESLRKTHKLFKTKYFSPKKNINCLIYQFREIVHMSHS